MPRGAAQLLIASRRGPVRREGSGVGEQRFRGTCLSARRRRESSKGPQREQGKNHDLPRVDPEPWLIPSAPPRRDGRGSGRARRSTDEGEADHVARCMQCRPGKARSRDAGEDAAADDGDTGQVHAQDRGERGWEVRECEEDIDHGDGHHGPCCRSMRLCVLPRNAASSTTPAMIEMMATSMIMVAGGGCSMTEGNSRPSGMTRDMTKVRAASVAIQRAPARSDHLHSASRAADHGTAGAFRFAAEAEAAAACCAPPSILVR